MEPDDPAWADDELPGRGGPWWRRTRRSSGGMGNDDSCDLGSGDSGSGGCDVSGCDGCDSGGCSLLRLSALLTVAAVLVPARDGGLVARLVRIYRRHLTRLTPSCPSTPSCSAYALEALESLGPRRGLAAAGRRVRACGRPVAEIPPPAPHRRTYRG